MTKLATEVRTFNDHAITFQTDGWFNATEAAEKFGRRVDHWLKTAETQSYIAALCDISNTPEKGYLKTKRGAGGGTWLHPKLAVNFARWLDPRFAVWCDLQIDELLRGKTNWIGSRHQASASFRLMSDMLKLSREDAGKTTASHHYSNEARLVNWAFGGEFTSLERDSLCRADLDLLAHLEEKNALLMGRGVAYDKRKPMLQQYALDWRLEHSMGLLK